MTTHIYFYNRTSTREEVTYERDISRYLYLILTRMAASTFKKRITKACVALVDLRQFLACSVVCYGPVTLINY